MKGTKDLRAIVYQAINLINGKRYIGVTRRLRLAVRASEHRNAALAGRGNGSFYRAIRKYGFDVFRFSIIKQCETAHEALTEEIRLIALWNPAYNSTLGGDGCLGRPMTSAGKARLSAYHKGRAWHGIPHSDDTRARLRAIGLKNKATWAKYAGLGPATLSKKVLCLDDGTVFASASEAARVCGVARSSLIELCLGNPKRKTVGGRRFAYVVE